MLDRNSEAGIASEEEVADLGAASFRGTEARRPPDPASVAGEAVLERLESLLAADPSEACVIELLPGASVEDLSRQAPSVSFVLVSGSLSFRSLCGEWRIPPGYCLVNPDALISPPSELRPEIGEEGAMLLAVPRPTLSRWMREDPALHRSLNDLLCESYPSRRMPETAKERIRAARDQNIIALVTREAIGIVNGAGGVLDILNPGKVAIGGPDGGREGIIEQTWRLVRAVTPVALRHGKEDVSIFAMDARTHALAAGGDEEAVTASATSEMLRSLALEKQNLLERSCPLLSVALELADYEPAERAVITDRILQIRWLDKRLRDLCGQSAPGAAIWEGIINQELADAGRPDKQNFLRILDVLDARLETLFDFGVEKQLPGLASIAFRKCPHELDVADPACEELPASHPGRAALEELGGRLARGETSAVGGSAYAEMRFPRETLEAIARGEAPAVFFDGDHEMGIRFVRERFGRSRNDPSVLEPCTVMELQGAYGSFSRSWIFFKDGTSAVLVSYVGEARQLSNAAAMLLYDQEGGGRIGPESMILAREKRPIRERLRSDLETILEEERDKIAGRPILGRDIPHPERLPTQVLIIQHPDQLAEALGRDAELHEMETENLGTVYLGYWRNPSGGVTRLIVPKVGSSGLYGDTAGEFLKLLWEKDLVKNLVPHVLFTGTAGGFGPGIGDLAPGALFTPTEGVTDATGTVAMRSLSGNPAAAAALDASGVFRHALHYSVGAPALETFELIDELMGSGHGSIDVESGPIMRAVAELAASSPGISFTPVYFFSDNPLEARENPSNTLAYGGPLAEGSKKVPELYAAIKELMNVSHEERAGLEVGRITS